VKVFLVANSLAPAYGGPARSVSRLASVLGDDGADVGLWAPDGSAITTPLLDAGAPLRCLAGSADKALAEFGEPAVIHDNGIWMPHHHRLAQIARSRGIPRIVSTRGMLEPWAWSHKRLKKRIAWMLYQRRDLELAVRHHVTSETEARNLRDVGLGVPVCLIPNGVDVPDASLLASLERPASPLRTALFLGRIYPVKGLPMLVEAWARVRPAGWRLQIAGPDEAGHRAEVERCIAAAGLTDVVSFLGPLEGQPKARSLGAADLFVLPTYSENFGMAIGEALANGLPVLTTRGAPWPDLEPRGCGWWVEPSPDALADGLRRATALPAAELREMGRRGRALVSDRFGWVEVARRFRALYDEAAPGRCGRSVAS
jgi:glycosyltransferase involved in cell wall biosynthesis